MNNNKRDRRCIRWWIRFGNLNNGVGNGGLSCGNGNNGLSNANWNIGGRIYEKMIDAHNRGTALKARPAPDCGQNASYRHCGQP